MTPENQFAGLGLAEPLLRAVAETGYTTPTPIQLKAIPLVLAGGDLLAAAQTGTGKTAGFVLPILHRLHTNEPTGTVKPGRPRCLILTPTRELAAQVEESVQTYGKNVPVKSMVMFGGVGFQPQVTQLRKRLDILVATPGRLLDHAGQKTVDLSGVEILVLDEGDRMLDMGFIHDIKRILALLPKERQSMLFSATFTDEVRALANQLLNKPGSVDVAPRNTASELVQQIVHLVPKEQKRDLLSYLIKQNNWQQVLVFTRTKHGANRLAEKLERDGIAACAIHGNKSQAARTRALAQFKAGEVPVLVATDIAARGLDIEELPHVVNFELPNVAEDYVHRIGRTGRAGSTGWAVSLVDSEETQFLRDIEKLLKRPIERATVEGFVAPVRSKESLREEDARPPRQPRQPRANRGRQPERERQPARSGQRSDQRTNQSERGRQPGRPDQGQRTRPPARAGQGDRDQRRQGAPSHPRHHAARPQGEPGNRARPQQDGNEVDGNRARPQRNEERDGNRGGVPLGNRIPLDDDFGNRIQPQSPGRNRGEPDGNRAHHGAERQQMGESASEAARHQAQPQPALFSPPRSQHRRRG